MITDHTEKIKEKQKSGIITAFYSAYFSRFKTLSSSDLEEVLKHIDNPSKQKVIMSGEEMYGVMKRLAGI